MAAFSTKGAVLSIGSNFASNIRLTAFSFDQNQTAIDVTSTSDSGLGTFVPGIITYNFSADGFLDTTTLTAAIPTAATTVTISSSQSQWVFSAILTSVVCRGTVGGAAEISVSGQGTGSVTET